MRVKIASMVMVLGGIGLILLAALGPESSFDRGDRIRYVFFGIPLIIVGVINYLKVAKKS